MPEETKITPTQMNDYQVKLKEAVDLLATLPYPKKNRWTLYARNNAIHACQFGSVKDLAHPIVNLTKYDLKNGLPRKLWDTLEHKIRTLVEEGILCHEPLKH